MLNDLAQEIIELGTTKGVMIATAESCTGGLITGALTEIPGSSAVVDRGFVTYTNEAKAQMLSVPESLIEEKGAVSDSVVRAMVAGALANSRAQVAVAVTGIAGPGGGTDTKPVGLVYIAVQSQDGLADVRECRFDTEGTTDRFGIRLKSVQTALEMLLKQLKSEID